MKALIKLTSYLALIAGMLYFAQDFLVFPGILHAKKFRIGSDRQPTPLTVERIFATADDDHELVVWKLNPENARRVAILFHSTEESLPEFFSFQKFFKSQGYTSYAFDYRGFGDSPGWPSEDGLYRDGRAVVRKVTELEKIDAADLLFVGHGLGSAVAAKLAGEFSPKNLLLVAPVPSSIEQLALPVPQKYLLPVMRSLFPTSQYIKELKSSCLTIENGEQDSSSSSKSGEALLKLYQGSGQAKHLISPASRRGSEILRTLQPQADAAIRACAPNDRSPAR